MRIAEAAIAAARQYDLLAWLGEIGKQRLAVLLVNLRAGRNFENRVGAVGAVTILAHAGAAVLSKKVLLVAVVDQRVEPVDRDGDHVAAFAAVAGANVDLGFVEEFHREHKQFSPTCYA